MNLHHEIFQYERAFTEIIQDLHAIVPVFYNENGYYSRELTDGNWVGIYVTAHLKKKLRPNAAFATQPATSFTRSAFITHKVDFARHERAFRLIHKSFDEVVLRALNITTTFQRQMLNIDRCTMMIDFLSMVFDVYRTSLDYYRVSGSVTMSLGWLPSLHMAVTLRDVFFTAVTLKASGQLSEEPLFVRNVVRYAKYAKGLSNRPLTPHWQVLVDQLETLTKLALVKVKT